MGPFKGKGGSEHALFRQLLDRLEPGDVVLVGVIGYFGERP